MVYRKSPELTPELVDDLCADPPDVADLGEVVFGRLVEVEHLDLEDLDQLTCELTDFLDAIRGEAVPTVTGRDGYRAVEVAARILRAIGRSPVLG